MLLAVLDVFLRIFFKSPIVGATELIQILNVGIILALGTGSLANQNVTVDFVMDKVPLMPRIVIELIMDLINLALMIAVIITSFSLMLRSMERNSSYYGTT
jgi:TRAP-type C4-dicarboxylate transport system permease small subunit